MFIQRRKIISNRGTQSDSLVVTVGEAFKKSKITISKKLFSELALYGHIKETTAGHGEIGKRGFEEVLQLHKKSPPIIGCTAAI